MDLPKIRHCLVCEDIRLELRDLASFMGVYGATPYAGIKIRSFQLPVLFCLIFMGDPVEGKLAIKLNIRCSDGTPVPATIFPEQNEQNYSREAACTFAFRVNAVFPRPDSYTLAVSANGTEFFKDVVK